MDAELLCPICKREVPRRRMTKHHLRTRKGDPDLIELICRECHSTIHRFFTNGELRDPDSGLNTVEGLLSNPEYAKAVAWISRQDPEKHPRIRTAKNKGRARP